MKKQTRRVIAGFLHAAMIQAVALSGCALDGDEPLADTLDLTVINGMDGTSLSGLIVSAYELGEDDSRTWRMSQTTDAQGNARFVLEGLDDGARYRLRMEPYDAGAVWTGDITAAGALDLAVGTSPVTLVDDEGLPIENVLLTAYLEDGGSSDWYKEGYTDSSGTVRFDFEALSQGAVVLVRAQDPLGTGEDTESEIIHDAGPVLMMTGNLGQPPTDPGSFVPSCELTSPSSAVYHVSTQGSDSNGTGTQTRPWASIGHALRRVPDGATIIVGSGTYYDQQLRGSFSNGVLVRAQSRYMTRLRSSSDKALRCYDCAGITVEGFDIAHSGPGAKPLVVHIQGGNVRNVTLRNNIIRDSYNNDLLKINNGASHIRVERNLFYNQQGSDEHIDINSVADVVVQDNVFFNHFAASGRSNRNNTSSYIVIKDSNGNEDRYRGAERITIRRNVFLNWEGGNAHNFVLVGEDAKPYIEAKDVLIENNLFLGNSRNQMRAALGVKSGADVTFRHNTVVGDLPSRAFAMRLNAENSSIQNRNIRFYNNIWSDPTGTMERFSTTPRGHTASFALDNNLYWNGSRSIPERSDDLINVSNDRRPVRRDPLLPNPRNVTPPSWNGTSFADGSSDICGVFRRLVTNHGTPAAGSPAINAARADQSPGHDILGRVRTSPDLGAVER